MSGDKTTLPLWKTATSQDLNSLNTEPSFINTSSFSPTGLLPKSNLTGTAVSITTDYEGKTRGGTPRMGALEGFIWKGTTSTDFNTASNWLCNQVPGSGSSVIFDNAPVNSCLLDQNRTVASIINAQSTYVFDVNGQTLTVTGDISLSNGAKVKADATNSTLVFAGTTAQTISSAAFGSYPVYNLTVNNSAGVTSNCDFTISNILTLTSGVLNIGSSNLTLGSGSSISGTPSSANMIVATGTGELRKTFTASGSFTYPVGDNTGTVEYSPITLNFTSGTFSTAYAGVNLSNAKHPYNTTGTDYLNRYWTVNQSGISGFSCNVTCQYLSSDIVGTELNIWTSKYSNSTWVLLNQADALNHRLTGTVTGFSSFTGGQQGPLPVHLSSFSSRINGRDILLNWKTDTEQNNSHFNVERKTITSDWKNVGRVNGNGNSGIPVLYTYSDNKLNTGKYQYRLKQIDNNGNFEYFNLNADVEIGIPTKYELSQNYPNPFNPVTKIDFSIPLDAKVKMTIYDITGKEMINIINDTRTAGYYTVQFDASRFSSGTYFYRLIANANGKDFISTKKMILLK